MNFRVNEVIKFKKGDYLILDIIKKDNNTYLYLINNDEFKDDVSITKVLDNDGVVEYTFIDDEEEFNYVLNQLLLDNKDKISEFLIEEE